MSSNGYYALATGLLVILSVLSQFQQGSALECYQCNTESNPKDCASENLADSWRMPCSNNETMCRKIEQEMNIDGEDTVRVTRECATSRSAPTGDCLERTGTYRFKTWYCECDEDNCNGATALSTVSMFFISSAYLLSKRIL